MSKIESSSSSEKNKRRGTRAIRFVLAFSAAALAVSGAAYGAKPVPSLNATVCQSISGTWTAPACTIPAGSNGVASSDFRITRTSALNVKGSLTINTGVTISNSGTINVDENVTGVTVEVGPPVVTAGILVLGTLDNSGVITIKNATDNTEGIAVSALVSYDPLLVPNPYLIVPGVLTNSGTIAVQNTGQTQGINNTYGVLNNSASGTITITNSGTVTTPSGLVSSVGIRNARLSTITNAGRITIANSGDAGVTVGTDVGVGGGRGISNAGFFTNSATGTFTISPSGVLGDTAWGLRNNGSFTNFGTLINNRGTDTGDPLTSTLGSYNLSPGAMINYGKTYVGTPTDPRGTFYSEFLMMNLGEITSYGALVGGAYLNYGTIYNYGFIGSGEDVGLCIDEPASPGIPAGSGC